MGSGDTRRHVPALPPVGGNAAGAAYCHHYLVTENCCIASLINANLSYSFLDYTDLAEADLTGTDLTGVDLDLVDGCDVSGRLLDCEATE